MPGPDDTGELHGDPMEEQEQHVVGLLHALRADRAPDRLRADIERLRAAPRRQTSRQRRMNPWWRPTFGLAAATSAAAIVAVVVALTAGGSGSSSVLQVAALALRGPVIAAPAPDPNAPQMRLSRDVQTVYFPNWSRFGWRATGQRVDRVDGRLAVTVYYRRANRSLAYTILASPPLPAPNATATTFAGTLLRTLHMRSRMAVTWRRVGHTCVLSGTGISARTLYGLAAWHPAGSDA